MQDRMLKLDLEILRLPLGALVAERHVPIYVSKDLHHKKRVIVVFGERNQDLGIFSYRSIGEDGIKVGSAQDFANTIINGPKTTSADEVPGIIITNPGQLIWYRGGSRAIGYNEHLNMPRLSAVHGPFRIDPVKNRAPGNSNFTEHVQYVFENVMAGIVSPDAKFDIIGLEYTGDAVIQYLSDHWSTWNSRIDGICLGNPQLKLSELSTEPDQEGDFTKFLAKRARAYFVSDKPIETPILGRDEYGYNCYASGESLYEDGILIKGWRSMLDWFNMISVLGDYEEPVFTMVDATEDNHDNI